MFNHSNGELVTLVVHRCRISLFEPLVNRYKPAFNGQVAIVFLQSGEKQRLHSSGNAWCRLHEAKQQETMVQVLRYVSPMVWNIERCSTHLFTCGKSLGYDKPSVSLFKDTIHTIKWSEALYNQPVVALKQCFYALVALVSMASIPTNILHQVACLDYCNLWDIRWYQQVGRIVSINHMSTANLTCKMSLKCQHCLINELLWDRHDWCCPWLVWVATGQVGYDYQFKEYLAMCFFHGLRLKI